MITQEPASRNSYLNKIFPNWAITYLSLKIEKICDFVYSIFSYIKNFSNYTENIEQTTAELQPIENLSSDESSFVDLSISIDLPTYNTENVKQTTAEENSSSDESSPEPPYLESSPDPQFVGDQSPPVKKPAQNPKSLGIPKLIIEPISPKPIKLIIDESDLVKEVIVKEVIDQLSNDQFSVQTLFIAAIKNQKPSEIKDNAFLTFCKDFDKAIEDHCPNPKGIDRIDAIKKAILGFGYLQKIFLDGGDHTAIDALVEEFNDEEKNRQILDCIGMALFALHPMEQGTYVLHEKTENLEYFLSKLGFKERLSSHFKERTVGSPMGIDGSFTMGKRHLLYHLLKKADPKNPSHSIALKFENWGLDKSLDIAMHTWDFFKSVYRRTTGDNGQGYGYNKEHLLKEDLKAIQSLITKFTELFPSKVKPCNKERNSIVKGGYGLAKAIPVMQKIVKHIDSLIEAKEAGYVTVVTEEMENLHKNFSNYIEELQTRENYNPNRSGNEATLNFKGLSSIPRFSDKDLEALSGAAEDFLTKSEWVSVSVDYD